MAEMTVVRKHSCAHSTVSRWKKTKKTLDRKQNNFLAEQNLIFFFECVKRQEEESLKICPTHNSWCKNVTLTPLDLRFLRAWKNRIFFITEGIGASPMPGWQRFFSHVIILMLICWLKNVKPTGLSGIYILWQKSARRLEDQSCLMLHQLIRSRKNQRLRLWVYFKFF